MKYIFALLPLVLLAGCNSSSSETEVAPQSPPVHLPEGSEPDRPHPDIGDPGHLPGDLTPDRLPIAWFNEVSARFGMSLESLGAVCRYQGDYPQINIHVSCQWDGEELTIVYYVSRGIVDPDYFYEHAFIWVVSDEKIGLGEIWPAINHDAIGHSNRNIDIAEDAASFNIRYQCEDADKKCRSLVHTLNISTDHTKVLSDGTHYYGNTDFDMDVYKNSERFYFRVDITDLDTGYTYNNTLHLLDDFPPLMYDVLAPAFGY